ncbi:MAG: methanogenesis marker 14 protein [Methanophagales archaeon]|nr:methanogenesis marker 14 protein [Methanophagales archaeon]
MRLFLRRQKHKPRLLEAERISYSDLSRRLQRGREDAPPDSLFIVASVELGNSTTKAIVTATDLKSGRTYSLGKSVKMTRGALSPRDAFCHTLSMVDLSGNSIAGLVKETLQECTRLAGVPISDLHFVVRSTGVTASLSRVDEVEGVIKALAKGCILAGVPPRKMISPMTVDDIPLELRRFSRMEKTYFDGTVAGNIPPGGELIVANEMEGELVTAGLKEAAGWLDVDFRSPVLSLDLGTTLAGRITDAGLPYAGVIGSFCGLAGAIPDAVVSKVVKVNFPSVLDLTAANRKIQGKRVRVRKEVVKGYVTDILKLVRIEKVKKGCRRIGGVPVNSDAAAMNGVVLIGIDAGENLSNLPKISDIGAELMKEEGEEYIIPVIDSLSTSIIVDLIRIAKEEGLILPETKIGVTGRAGITGKKPELILEELSALFGRNMDKEVIFADDALARGAAVLGRCMHQFGTVRNPLGGIQGRGCVYSQRKKLQKK